MIKRIKAFKGIIIWIAILTLLILGSLTIDAINETDNWKPFDLDFNSKDHIISSYGTLIGGILAFLSILFVIYQIQDERQFNLQEKKNKEQSEKEELLDRLKMLNSLVKTILKEILNQGKVMKKFAEDELNSPSNMNMMSFRSINNFRRLINMDELTNYKAFRLYFNNENWEKIFINFNNIIDFYYENLNELNTKFNSQISEKAKHQKKITSTYNKLISKASDLIDEYHMKFAKDEYLKKPWSQVVNEFILYHHKYLKDCEINGEINNLRTISDTILQPFIKKGVDLRDKGGYDEFNSKELISKASSIRKEINAMEMHCKFYAKDVEKYYNDYYSDNNSTLNHLNEIHLKLEKIINPMNS